MQVCWPCYNTHQQDWKYISCLLSFHDTHPIFRKCHILTQLLLSYTACQDTSWPLFWHATENRCTVLMKSTLTVSTSSLHEWSIESGVYDNCSTKLLQTYPSCYNKNMKEGTWHRISKSPKLSTHAVASPEMTHYNYQALNFWLWTIQQMSLGASYILLADKTGRYR